MEDLWKNITLSTLSSLHNPSSSSAALLHQTPHHHNHFQPNLTTTIFQDFLAQQFSHNDRTKTIAIVSASSQPQTILSLNSDHPPPDFHLNDSASGHSPPVFDNTCSSARHCCTCKRRVVQQESESDEMKTQHPFDQRHKRMIKNRESAARSRARKQAYTVELELEVAQLKQENAILRKEQEIRNRADMDQSWPKKHKHHRTSTAPF
ncbi:hypothetical protein QQ045_010737 [Rhodiola kirilowii]